MEDINQNEFPDNLGDLFNQVNFSMIDTCTTNRFAPISASDVDEFLEDNENINTKRKTTGDLNVFNQFLASRNEHRTPETIPAVELNLLLCQFILAVRKKDSSEHEPSTLRGYMSSIDRYLKKKEYGVSIMNDIQFAKCRETLKSKMKNLKSMGKGNKPRAAAEVSDDQLQEMYDAGNLGPETPSSLINSLWLMCTTHFGMRTGKETHNLKWGDVQIMTDDSGDEYLLHSQERQTKTRTGENERNTRLIKPRAYALPDIPERDPVYLYKLYRSKRPVDYVYDLESPFFLAVNYQRTRPDAPWYKKNAMGINSIYAIMKNMKVGTGIEHDERITPYSVRKHLVQKLRDTGLPPNDIIQVTGHKNVNSINNYSNINPERQKNISHTLSTNPSTTGQVSLLPSTNPPTVMPSSTIKHAAGVSPSLPMSGSTSYTASQSRNFLSSIMTANTIHGNVTINVAPEMIDLGVSRSPVRHASPSLTDRGMKRPLDY